MFHGCYGRKIVAPPTVVSLGGCSRVRPFPPPCRPWLGPCTVRFSPNCCWRSESHKGRRADRKRLEAHIVEDHLVEDHLSRSRGSTRPDELQHRYAGGWEVLERDVVELLRLGGASFGGIKLGPGSSWPQLAHQMKDVKKECERPNVGSCLNDAASSPATREETAQVRPRRAVKPVNLAANPPRPAAAAASHQPGRA